MAVARRAARFGVRGGSKLAVCIDPSAAGRAQASSTPMERAEAGKGLWPVDSHLARAFCSNNADGSQVDANIGTRAARFVRALSSPAICSARSPTRKITVQNETRCGQPS
jgi:hypothetical protein